MAHKKAGGSTRLGRDSAGQRLGVKMNDGQAIKTGMIIIRQRGTRYFPGTNVKVGKDDTIYSMADGIVKFSNRKMMKFDGSLKQKKIVNVIKQ